LDDLFLNALLPKFKRIVTPYVTQRLKRSKIFGAK
jgi:hypothetical protein